MGGRKQMKKRVAVKVYLDGDSMRKIVDQINYLKEEIQKLKTVAAELNSCISNLELQIDGRSV